ncbi:MAG: hypothetical protein J5506_07950 [Prevotella sp.]|nr:hypothetical protein [Prevotella sp.]
MKRNSIKGLLLLTAATLLASCSQSNVKMHTTVHEDGWIDREFSYSTVMTKEERDSMMQSEGARLAYPIPECLNTKAFMGTHTEVEGDTVTTTFSRSFRSPEEMCKESPLQLNGTRLQSKATLDKRFRWFYTEYTFTEVFHCVGDTFKLAPTAYADKDVVSYWFTGQPNLVEGLSGAEASQRINEMEPFVSKWLNDNLYKVCFDYIVKNYDSIPHPPVSRSKFISLHDSLANHLMAGKEDITDVEPTKALRAFFHSDAYAMFFDENTPLGQALNKELANRLNILWFNVPYTLSMPGLVTNPGTGIIRDGVIHYTLTGERMIPQDYTITATSRVTHLWAYAVTLLIILIAIGSFLRWGKKKNI